MKPSLQAGAAMTRRIAIDRDRTIGFMGEDARVYATPSLIMDISAPAATCSRSTPMPERIPSALKCRSSISPRPSLA